MKGILTKTPLKTKLEKKNIAEPLSICHLATTEEGVCTVEVTGAAQRLAGLSAIPSCSGEGGSKPGQYLQERK